jgi:hypothetical protein
MKDVIVFEVLEALSIKQYWLHAILNFGKEIENRTWRPPPWIIGGRIALHASKTADPDSLPAIKRLARLSSKKMLEIEAPFGAILATARVEGCCTQSNSGWFFGPYGWILKDLYVLKEPYPCKGALRLWTVPPGIAREIRLEEAKELNG